MVIKTVNNIERIEYHSPVLSEKVKKLIDKKSKCKTIEKYIEIQLKVLKNNKENWSNIELVQVFEDLFRKAIELRSKAKVSLKSWRGKSSFQVIKTPKCFIVTTYQREDKDSEPHEVVKEITKEQMNEVIIAIQKLDDGNKIPTRKIGELAYQKEWDSIFSDRQLHMQLNLILRVLDHYGFILYRSRFSKVLNKKLDIQLLL